MKIDEATARSLFNVQYGVCFGVVFSNHFISPENQQAVLYNLPSEPQIWIAGLILTLYFFFDWGTMNVLRILKQKIKEQISLIRIILMSIWIWFLGTVVILAGSDETAKFIILALYAFTVGLYHSYNYFMKWYPVAGFIQMLGILLSIKTVFLSLILFLHWFVVNRNLEHYEFNFDAFIAVASAILLLKIVHLYFLSTSQNKIAVQ